MSFKRCFNSIEDLKRFSDFSKASFSSIFVAVILRYNDKILAIKETDKKFFRFPGGKAEKKDDRKKNSILSSFLLRGITNKNDFFKISQQAAKRELLEEISLEGINENNLRFVYVFIEKDKEINFQSYHMKAFFEYQLSDEEVKKINFSSSNNLDEAEKIEDYKWLEIKRKNDGKISINPPIKISKHHFLALLSLFRK